MCLASLVFVLPFPSMSATKARNQTLAHRAADASATSIINNWLCSAASPSTIPPQFHPENYSFALVMQRNSSCLEEIGGVLSIIPNTFPSIKNSSNDLRAWCVPYWVPGGFPLSRFFHWLTIVLFHTETHTDKRTAGHHWRFLQNPTADVVNSVFLNSTDKAFNIKFIFLFLQWITHLNVTQTSCKSFITIKQPCNRYYICSKSHQWAWRAFQSQSSS